VYTAPTFVGSRVSLEVLSLQHVGELVAAANEDRSTYGFTYVPAETDSMVEYVRTLIADREAGRAVPFVQRRLADDNVVGCTRFMNPYRWFGRGDVDDPFPDEVEIGGTWLAASAQRTGVNLEAKLLLLTFAFEHWGVGRVAICTDARNERSRRAITGIGAELDGVLHRHRPSTTRGEEGTLRDSALYSVTAERWPLVRDRLESSLAMHEI